MKWKKYNKTSGLHVCPQMDMYLTSCGFTKASAYYLTHPCEMHDKYLLHDLREVVHAIGEFIKNNKKILKYMRLRFLRYIIKFKTTYRECTS